jgi:hypothetical protein
MPTKLAIVKIIAHSSEPFQINPIIKQVIDKLIKESGLEIDWGFYLKPGTNHRVYDDSLNDGQWLELKQYEEKAMEETCQEADAKVDNCELTADEEYENYFDELGEKKLKLLNNL